MSQVHKRFTPDQVKELLERYSNNDGLVKSQQLTFVKK